MSTVDGEVENSQQAGLCCPRCSANNLPQRKFCAKCGAPLWEACFQCGEICPVGENYCGACGANLGDAAAEQLERVQDAFRAVASLREECRYNEAIALLAPVTKNKHPRLLTYAGRASQLLSQLVAERDRRRIAAAESAHRAKSLFEANDYDQAARLLDEIPQAFRSEEIDNLASQIAARRQEIAELTEALRDGVRTKRLSGLLPKIERLLVLKPDHPYAGTLARQVSEHLVGAAEKKLAAHQYDEALRLLEQISPSVRGARSQQLYRQAAELAWLDRDLRNAPVIDATLLAVAERFRRLAPNDARGIARCEGIERRRAALRGEKPQTLTPWAAPPRETPVGVPVEWFADSPRMACDGESESVLSQSPGRFAVACGLGLAGVKRAALQINLLSAEQRGVLRRFARLLQAGSAHASWGLDLSASGLKAVKLRWDASQGRAAIETAVLMEHAKPLNYAVNEAESNKLVADTLKAFVEKYHPKTECVCVGLPGRMALSRQVEMPPIEKAKISKMIEFEAQQQFPFPLEQLAWDYQVYDPSEPAAAASSGQPWHRVLLVGTQDATMRRFLEAFRRVNLRVDVVQTDFIALHNLVLHSCFASSDGSSPFPAKSAAAVLDVGCEVTNIVVSSPQCLWFRSSGVASHSFTRAAVKDFNLSIAQAEQLKRAPASAQNISEVYASWSPLFEDLVREVQQALAAFARVEPECPVQKVFGLGGGFQLHGLFLHLRSAR